MPSKKKGRSKTTSALFDRAEDWENDMETLGQPVQSQTEPASEPTAASTATAASSATAEEKSLRHADFLNAIPYSPPVYAATDDAAWLEYMQEHGYAVIQVLSEREVYSAEESFWADAAAHLGWDPLEPKTWHTTDRTSHPPGTLNRLRAKQQNGGDTGHMRGWDYSEFQWRLHKSVAVRHVYATLTRQFGSERAPSGEVFDHDDQLSSINGINVFRPHGLHPTWRTTAQPWYHVDNDTRPERTEPHGGWIFPGIVNLYPVSAASGGFVAVPKSHLLYQPRCASSVSIVHEEHGSGYLDLSAFTNYIDSEPNARAGNSLHTQPILVCTEQRGTLTVWDPRLVHCSTSSLLPPEENVLAREPQLLRLAGYVSLCPRAWASADALAARRQLAEERTCLNSAVPYDIVRKRSGPAIAWYQGLWEDEAALRLLGVTVRASPRARLRD